MQRAWFFFTESLQITASERRVLLTLMSVFLLLTIANTVVPARTVYDDEWYKPVIAEFHERSRQIEAEHEVFMARYTGEQLSAAVADTGQPSGASQQAVSASDSPKGKQVCIQTAEEEELRQIPGIGPVMARRIVAYRDEHGPFIRVEELLGVSGIGPATLERMRPYITIEQAAAPAREE